MDLSTLTITEARRALDAKEYTSLELTNAYLDAIREKNKSLNAYVEVWEDSAREEAKAADAAIARGDIMPLTGIPLANKDNILMEGRGASAASKMLMDYKATYDATVIQKLRAQNAVFLGRTNMDEFAMGSSTETSAYGPSKNPHDLTRIPGGSSGGASAAVAGNIALGALGSETCGSIRQPASHTGLVGLNPTFGAVSRNGLIAMGSSLDQIGPLTKTVADTKIIFDAIRGLDPLDSTSIPDSSFSKAGNPRVIGIPKAFFAQGVSPDVRERFDETLRGLEKAGYELRDIELPNASYALAVYCIISRAESSTNLARFDGIRYGLSVDADTVLEAYTKARSEGFGEEARLRVLVGTFVLSSGYMDAYYRKAVTVRELIRQELNAAFDSVDAIVTPTCAAPAFVIGAKSDPLAMYAEDMFAAPADLADIPAMSVPMGTVVRDGVSLPVGFNIMGRYGGEETIFKVGEDVEKVRRT